MDGKTLHHTAAEEKENWRTTTTTNSKTIRRLERGREQHGDGTHFSLVVALDVQYSTAPRPCPRRQGRASGSDRPCGIARLSPSGGTKETKRERTGTAVKVQSSPVSYIPPPYHRGLVFN